MKINAEIYQLITAWLLGTITEQENQALQQWLAEDERNCQLFRELCDRDLLREDLKLYNSFKTADKWEDFNRRFFSTPRCFKYQKFFAYAAVILLLFGLGGISYWFIHHLEDGKKVLQVGQVCDKWQAVLIVDNGQEFVLNGIKDTCLCVNGNEVLLIDGHGSLAYDSLYQKTNDSTWHTLRVPRGGEYKLILEDGTQVWINSASELKYPAHFNGGERKVIVNGEAYFKVARNEEKPFIVQAGGLDVKVLGTSFDVSAYSGEKGVYATLLEGSVEVIKRMGRAERLVLNPGEQAVLEDGNLSCREVNADLYCSWIKNCLTFVGEDLEMVTRKLERWYNVNFFFAHEEMKEMRFTGSIPKYIDISKVLTMLEMTTDVQFILKNNTVTVERSRK